MNNHPTSELNIKSAVPRNPIVGSRCPDKICLMAQCGNLGFEVHDEGHVYDVVRCDRIFSKVNPTLAQRIAGRRAFALIDPIVHRLRGEEIRGYLDHFQITSIRFVLPAQPINEWNKELSVAAQVSAEFQNSGLRKGDLVILIGGGVVKDLGAFVAKAYRRGVNFIVIPTTLLAMVDAAPSPKCAVNVGGRKNLWSDKHYPEAVLYDPTFLESLDNNAFKEGLAEVAKVAVIGSRSLFEFLESQSLVSLRSEICSGAAGAMLTEAIKLFLELKWTGPCYGNVPASIRSFGHGFEREMETNSRFALQHGAAVSVEMHVATRLARNLGKIDGGNCRRILDLLDHLGLPPMSEFCEPAVIWERVFNARQTAGENFYYPIPTGIGSGGFLDTFSFGDLLLAISGSETDKHILAFSE